MRMHSNLSTSSFKISLKTDKDSQRLFTKLLLVLLPLFMIAGFSFILLFVSGELDSIAKIVKEQRDNKGPALLGLAYSNPIVYFNLSSANFIRR